MNLSEKLKVLRKASGKSREVVANDLRIKPRTLQAYETGERIPTVDTIVLIAKYYKVTTDFLLGMAEKSDFSGKKKIFSENIARKLIESFDARSDEAKIVILDFLEDFVKAAKQDEKEKLAKEQTSTTPTSAPPPEEKTFTFRRVARKDGEPTNITLTQKELDDIMNQPDEADY